MKHYNEVIVVAPEHYQKKERVMLTDDEIKFTTNGGQQGIAFACGGMRYFFEYSKVIAIRPVNE